MERPPLKACWRMRRSQRQREAPAWQREFDLTGGVVLDGRNADGGDGEDEPPGLLGADESEAEEDDELEPEVNVEVNAANVEVVDANVEVVANVEIVANAEEQPAVEVVREEAGAIVEQGRGDRDEVEAEAAGQGEELISLVERANPTIPAPDPAAAGVVDADGWGRIGMLGGWASTLCQFPMLDECPLQHQEAFVAAWEVILQRLEGAGTEDELNIALMWLLFLPQALLRKPSRGARAGRTGCQALSPSTAG